MLLRHFAPAVLALVAILQSAPRPAGGDDGAGREEAPAPPSSESAPAESDGATAVAPPTAQAASAPGAAADAPTAAADKFERWLHEVDPLITRAERDAFLGLHRDHHRDAFIRRFWQVRDPYPETCRNELKVNCNDRIFTAQAEYESLADDRSRVLLVHGPPDATMEVHCTKTRVPVTVWLYQSSAVVNFRFLLVFVRSL